MQTVIQMLEDAAQKYENDPYLCQKEDEGWREMSFKEARDEAEFFAAGLIHRGFQKGENITIIAEGRINWITGEFGILMTGCTSVPISIKLLPGEIPFLLNHSESRAVLASENTLEKLLSVFDQVKKKPLIILLSNYRKTAEETCEKFGLGFNKDVVPFETLVQEGRDNFKSLEPELKNRKAQICEDDTVTISYTSGTTGNPKGIMLTHKNYWVNSRDAVNTFTIPERQRTLIILPLDHSFAHTVGLYVGLLLGLSLSFTDARGGGLSVLRNIPINLVERNPFFILTVPSLTGNFMKKMIAGVAEKGGFINKLFLKGVECGIRIHGDGFHKTSLRTRISCFLPYGLAALLIFPKLRRVFGNNIHFCVGGGALLEIKQQEFFNAIGAPVYQGYGLTEAAPIICANIPEKHKFGTSGIIFPSIECRIMKTPDEEAPLGVTGEIVIRGGNVMKGYFKNPEETAKTIRDGWLWTGDLGYKDADGFLVVVGREKALLIAADGEKYSPEEIEEAVLNHSTLINQIIAYNEQQKYTSALVTLNEGPVKEIITAKNLTTADEVLKEIHDSFYLFKGNGTRVPSQWIPGTFAIIPEAFSEENHLINSTMKMVRYKIQDFYRDRITRMYADESDYYNESNRQAVRSLFGVK